MKFSIVRILCLILMALCAPDTFALTLPIQAQWWWPMGRRQAAPPPPPAKPQKPAKRRAQPARKSAEAATSQPVETANPFASGQPTGDVVDLDGRSTETLAAEMATSETAKSESKASKKQKALAEPKSFPPAAAPSPLPSHNGLRSFVWDDADYLSQWAGACSTGSREILKINNIRADQLSGGQVIYLPEPVKETSLTEPLRQAEREINRGIRGRKQVALTFDAGGESEGLSTLLSNLKQADAPATFFMTGEFMRTNPNAAHEIVKTGLPVYNHSWSHPQFPMLTDQQIAQELGKTEQIIHEQTSKSTRPFWRPPFGESDKRCRRVAAQYGFQSIYWTLDSLDSVGSKKSSEFIVKRVMTPHAGSDLEASLDGAIILMHVGEPTTAEAVPELVRQLREQGFTPVTLEQLLTP